MAAKVRRSNIVNRIFRGGYLACSDSYSAVNQAHARDQNILPKRAGVELIAQNEKRFNDTGALVRRVEKVTAYVVTV